MSGWWLVHVPERPYQRSSLDARKVGELFFLPKIAGFSFPVFAYYSWRKSDFWKGKCVYSTRYICFLVTNQIFTRYCVPIMVSDACVVAMVMAWALMSVYLLSNWWCHSVVPRPSQFFNVARCSSNVVWSCRFSLSFNLMITLPTKLFSNTRRWAEWSVFTPCGVVICSFQLYETHILISEPTASPVASPII